MKMNEHISYFPCITSTHVAYQNNMVHCGATGFYQAPQYLLILIITIREFLICFLIYVITPYWYSVYKGHTCNLSTEPI